ncbi:MAG TPA: zinc ribbon domain-containing protein [Lacipirellulaceae bacterium]|nr:zinc ribbon domain-containing protein [Lacipirellulaceae bacterium]
MHCRGCGAETQPAAKFCSECGIIDPTLVVAEDADFSPEAKGPPSKSNYALIAGAAFVALLLLYALFFRNDFDGSGTWEGTYQEGGQSSSFTAILTQDNSQLSGRIHDGGGGEAEVSGTIDGANVTFLKKYNSGHEITYNGVLDAKTKTITGEWKADNRQGSFGMTLKPAIEPAQSAPQPPATSSLSQREQQEIAQRVFRILSTQRSRDMVMGSFECSRTFQLGEPTIIDVALMDSTGMARVSVPVTALAPIGSGAGFYPSCFGEPAGGWYEGRTAIAFFEADIVKWDSGWRMAQGRPLQPALRPANR